jgi:hypothetical protein
VISARSVIAFASFHCLDFGRSKSATFLSHVGFRARDSSAAVVAETRSSIWISFVPQVAHAQSRNGLRRTVSRPEEGMLWQLPPLWRGEVVVLFLQNGPSDFGRRDEVAIPMPRIYRKHRYGLFPSDSTSRSVLLCVIEQRGL